MSLEIFFGKKPEPLKIKFTSVEQDMIFELLEDSSSTWKANAGKSSDKLFHKITGEVTATDVDLYIVAIALFVIEKMLLSKED